MVSLLLIVKEHKFLFFKRKEKDTSFAGYWGLPGGSVEKGETPSEGMIREVQEELGIDIIDFRFLNRYNMSGNIINLYVHDTHGFDETSINLNNEHTEYKYFTFYEMQKTKRFIPSTNTFILDYLKSIGQ
jgi:mutator protein MutT